MVSGLSKPIQGKSIKEVDVAAAVVVGTVDAAGEDVVDVGANALVKPRHVY